MKDDEVEAVARALARLNFCIGDDGPTPEQTACMMQDAEVAIAALDQHRARG